MGGWGLGIPACTEADPPVNRITHTCKNITLATTSLRPVIRMMLITKGCILRCQVEWIGVSTEQHPASSAPSCDN